MADAPKTPDPNEPPDNASALASYFNNEQERAAVVSLEDARRRREEEARTATGNGGKAPPPPADDASDDDPAPSRKKKGGGKPFKPLPADCPVTCLGVDGSTYYFIDALGQFVPKEAGELGQNGVDDLFKAKHAQRWADEHFPRVNQHGDINGIDRDRLKRALVAACGEASTGGTFEPMQRVRGVGAWRDDASRLMWHMGDAIVSWEEEGRERSQSPGQIGELVYPMGARQPRPLSRSEAIASTWDPAAGTWSGPAGELLQLYRRWQWARGELDARLHLGFTGCAIVSGALQWRPSEWFTGDYSNGKSELQRVTYTAMGGAQRCVVQSDDASGAGIWQRLGFRALPVAIDELEADAENRKRTAIVELMRRAASKGTITRGGADHKAVEFTVTSCFMFSSILRLPLPPQDLSRLLLMELQPLQGGSGRFRWDAARVGVIGQAFRRRIIDAWSRWDELMAPWWDYLSSNIGNRSADVFGTVLAMQHALLFDTVATEDDVEELAQPLVPDIKKLLEAAGRDHDQMLGKLGSSLIEPWDKGQRYTVRQLAAIAAQLRPLELDEARRDHDERTLLPAEITPDKAQDGLIRIGLRVVRPRVAGRERSPHLAIAMSANGLERIFHGTRWQAGVWVQAAKRVPGAFDAKQRIDAGPQWCVCVPIGALLGEVKEEEDKCELTFTPRK